MNRPALSTLALHAIALALPLAGLAATWGWTHVRAQQGTEWDVPVEGYDPRDLLRGHYILFRYRWPGLNDSNAGAYSAELCLAGRPPRIERTYLPNGQPCPYPLRPRRYTHEGVQGLESGILYVPQDEARRMQENLQDPKQEAILRIRVRDDGLVTPLRMTFRPRPAANTP